MAHPQVAVFARLAEGGAEPVRKIEGQGSLLGRTMHGIAYDSIHDEFTIPQQFGQAIGKFQSISNKIADMYLRIEAARLLIYKVAWIKQQGKSAMAEAAMAKVFTSEAWIQSSLDAIQIHGALGYMTESEIERDLRDSVAGTIYSGTSEIQRMIIARTLGL